MHGHEILEPEKILEIWRVHFKGLATPSPMEYEENEKLSLATEQNRIIEELIIKNQLTMEPVLESEIEKAVTKLNSGKAPDIDGISGEHFKYAKNEIVPVLTDIIDSICKDLDSM